MPKVWPLLLGSKIAIFRLIFDWTRVNLEKDKLLIENKKPSLEERKITYIFELVRIGARATIGVAFIRAISSLAVGFCAKAAAFNYLKPREEEIAESKRYVDLQSKALKEREDAAN